MRPATTLSLLTAAATSTNHETAFLLILVGTTCLRNDCKGFTIFLTRNCCISSPEVLAGNSSIGDYHLTVNTKLLSLKEIAAEFVAITWSYQYQKGMVQISSPLLPPSAEVEHDGSTYAVQGRTIDGHLRLMWSLYPNIFNVLPSNPSRYYHHGGRSSMMHTAFNA